jgi:hypothetical protein
MAPTVMSCCSGPLLADPVAAGEDELVADPHPAAAPRTAAANAIRATIIFIPESPIAGKNIPPPERPHGFPAVALFHPALSNIFTSKQAPRQPNNPDETITLLLDPTFMIIFIFNSRASLRLDLHSFERL